MVLSSVYIPRSRQTCTLVRAKHRLETALFHRKIGQMCSRRHTKDPPLIQPSSNSSTSSINCKHIHSTIHWLKYSWKLNHGAAMAGWHGGLDSKEVPSGFCAIAVISEFLQQRYAKVWPLQRKKTNIFVREASTSKHHFNKTRPTERYLSEVQQNDLSQTRHVANMCLH